MESDPNIDETERAVLVALSAQIGQHFKEYSSLAPTKPSVVVENGHVTELYIIRLTQSSDIQPLQAFPTELTQLPKLKYLSLVGHQMLSIPESIGELTNLISLDLSWNPIHEISQNLTRLTQLKELNISFNRMDALPQWLEEFAHDNYMTIINKRPTGSRLGDEPNDGPEDPWRDFANYPY